MKPLEDAIKALQKRYPRAAIRQAVSDHLPEPLAVPDSMYEKGTYRAKNGAVVKAVRYSVPLSGTWSHVAEWRDASVTWRGKQLELPCIWRGELRQGRMAELIEFADDLHLNHEPM